MLPPNFPQANEQRANWSNVQNYTLLSDTGPSNTVTQVGTACSARFLPASKGGPAEETPVDPTRDFLLNYIVTEIASWLLQPNTVAH